MRLPSPRPQGWGAPKARVTSQGRAAPPGCEADYIVLVTDAGLFDFVAPLSEPCRQAY